MPKCYNDKKEYVETADLQAFILSNSPFCVLDAIEFFAKHSISDDFEPQINAILKLNEIPFQLSKGKLMNTFDTQINKKFISVCSRSRTERVITRGFKNIMMKTICKLQWRNFGMHLRD